MLLCQFSCLFCEEGGQGSKLEESIYWKRDLLARRFLECAHRNNAWEIVKVTRLVPGRGWFKGVYNIHLSWSWRMLLSWSYSSGLSWLKLICTLITLGQEIPWVKGNSYKGLSWVIIKWGKECLSPESLIWSLMH